MTDHSIETLPSNSNKTHTFILLTLYHLVGPIYTQRMEEGKWNDPVKNFAFFKKSTTPYLCGLFIYMRIVAHVSTFAQEKTLYIYFVLNLSCIDRR